MGHRLIDELLERRRALLIEIRDKRQADAEWQGTMAGWRATELMSEFLRCATISGAGLRWHDEKERVALCKAEYFTAFDVLQKGVGSLLFVSWTQRAELALWAARKREELLLPKFEGYTPSAAVLLLQDEFKTIDAALEGLGVDQERREEGSGEIHPSAEAEPSDVLAVPSVMYAQNERTDGTALLNLDTSRCAHLSVEVEGLSATILNNYNGHGTYAVKVYGTMAPAQASSGVSEHSWYVVQGIAYDADACVLGVSDRQFDAEKFDGLVGFELFFGDYPTIPAKILIFPRVQ